ncbi:DUF2970 domain-containing protein [Alishewanella sp. d11]|uniref:DUF2970 domain-containing protein n=1 Tax=Alishewanella sp. d11 TaxID=3414030 RepID=UPI003BF7A88D
MQIAKAVLGAFIGVQSEQQRLKDFQSTSALPYIVTALVFALVFIGILILIVSLVLS